MKTLIVDDHPVVLQGISRVLDAEGITALGATNFADAMKLVRENVDMEVAVIDLYLGNRESGLDLLAELRKIIPGLRAVIYTMYDDIWNITRIKNANVEGAAIKGEDISELITAVKTVSGGKHYMSPELKLRFDAVRHTRQLLSEVDIKILEMVADGKSNAEIADSVFLSEKSIEYHRNKILKKLGAKTMSETIKNAVKLGIISCLTFFMTFIAKADGSTVPEAVDLGLSVKWADRNLGADSSLGEGHYYAYAETEPKEKYNWDTYTFCTAGNMFEQHNIGDNSICGTEYDAACRTLGDGWRMPSYEEMEELINNCSVEIFDATDETLPFARFTAANGAYIDFPFTGYRNEDKYQYYGSEAELYCGTFRVEAGEEEGFVYYLNSPWYLVVGKIWEPMLLEGSAHLGFQIRPVKNSATTSVEALKTICPAAPTTVIYTIDGHKVGTSLSGLSRGFYIESHSDGTVRRVFVP